MRPCTKLQALVCDLTQVVEANNNVVITHFTMKSPITMYDTSQFYNKDDVSLGLANQVNIGA